MEDHEIVALYWRRSERAVAETDAKYGAFCHTVALGLLSVREDAEECVNDAYQAAWESMPEEKPDKLRAWLGRVVRNLSIDRWRKNHRQKRYAGLETLLSELDDLISAAYAVERAEYPKSHTVVGDAAPDDGGGADRRREPRADHESFGRGRYRRAPRAGACAVEPQLL